MRLEIPGLKLPTLNVVLGTHWRKRGEEVKRVRGLVASCAGAAGLGAAKPSKLCDLTITVRGPYQRVHGHSYDTNNLYVKDLIDALIAKPLHTKDFARKAGIDWEANRRWGLITDDTAAVIGAPKIELLDADDFGVLIEVVAK